MITNKGGVGASDVGDVGEPGGDESRTGESRVGAVEEGVTTTSSHHTAGPRVRREGDQLRGELLRAAAELASGPRPVTIPSLRAVARECGVSAAAVYRHFASQAALTRALLETEHHALEVAILAVDDPEKPPEQRLRDLARAYVGWGMANPGMYQLLFESAELLDPETALVDIADRVMEVGEKLLMERLPDLDPQEAARRVERFWFGAHGIVSLRIHKPLRTWRTDPLDEAERLLEQLL